MLDIQRQFINYNKTSRSQKPIFIVIHDTGDPGATAQNEHDYFSGGNRSASADFFVDSNNIIQIIDTDNYYSWAIGDGHGKLGKTNGKSVSIEMCLESNAHPSSATVQNTLDLTRYLMDRYNIGIDNVVRHYDCSYKCCPASLSNNSWARWYDFKEQLRNGGTISGTWINKENKWWYKHDDGSFTKDGWEKISGKWYLFDSEGWMLYDWKLDDGIWYYLGQSDDGSMKTGWILQDGQWYYFNDSGAMQTGWIKYKGEWYFLKSNGQMATGWIQYDDNWYLLDSQGIMYSNCEVYGYKFASDGVATKIE